MELFSGGWEVKVDSVIEVRHINAELQGGCGDDCADVVVPEAVFDLLAVLGEVTGTIWEDVLGPVDVLYDSLDALAGVVECDDLRVRVGVDD